MQIIRSYKYGFRSVGFGYWWNEPATITFHIDLWWWSIRFNKEN